MMSAIAADYRITAKDYFALPEGPPYFQLIDGELYMSPFPNRCHQDVARNIGVPLTSHVEAANLGTVYFVPRDIVFTEEHIFQPDLYFVCSARSEILDGHGAMGAPDLIVEVLSPGTATLELGRKREIFAQAGVTEFWAVSPKSKMVEVFRFAERKDGPTAVLKDSDTLTTPLLPGFQLSLSRNFRE
jgi:Uma2 family endonuclease